MEIKSLREASEFSSEQFTKRIVYKKGESVVFVLNFNPGQELPPHKHPGTNIFILVLEGNGTITVDGASSEVTAEDVICCEGGEQFSFKNTGSGKARLYVELVKIPDESYAKNI
ncbi:MAG TPA: cupin domain-containing protein [Bacilli bacterium]